MSFNRFAASMRPQRFSCGIATPASRPEPDPSCFNEAAAFQLRNRAQADEARAAQFASMRPQRFSCGIGGLRWGVRRTRGASMRPQRFSCGIFRRRRMASMGKTGFNEAAAFQLRNLLALLRLAGKRAASMRPQRFSCGIIIRKMREKYSAIASMRPQRFSCGIMRQLSRLSRRCRRFNEAAAFQLRNRSSCITYSVASMRLQ